ncbi:MAG: hypothetical protein RMI53_00960 [Nitrososphaerota archaeon]|nr:hypothetical protein [Nitrososphaerota archaeon]
MSSVHLNSEYSIEEIQIPSIRRNFLSPLRAKGFIEWRDYIEGDYFSRTWK